MRYYAKYNGDELIAVGTGCGGTEITEEQYKTFLDEIREKAELTNKLYDEEITADDVPEKWRDEIQQRVAERKAAESEAEQQDIPADEALNIILGGETA